MAQNPLVIPRDAPYPAGTSEDSTATKWEKIEDNFDDLTPDFYA